MFRSSSALLSRWLLRFQLWSTSLLASCFPFRRNMDLFDHIKGCNTLDQMIGIKAVGQPEQIEAIGQPEPQKPTWCEKKQVAVQEERSRMSQLPANSTYVAHRLRVLNKIMQLMSIQRTVSQEEELESLFAGLSL